MLSGVPNCAFTVGYTNASWTLKADLTSEYVCRLLAHMDAHGYRISVPELTDPSVTAEPLLDFSSGYVLRAFDRAPQAGLQGALAAAPELHLRSADHPPR